MTTKKHAQSGFLDLRALIILLLCAVTSLTVAGTLLGFFRPETQAGVSQRTLTFEERVAYQGAIEDVYWRHRIWQKENPNPKPSLDAMMTQAQLGKKVADYLRNSQAPEGYWPQPITAEQLQAEMDRMAQNTKQPEVLRELFEALGNDPFVIAECLARPLLAEQLLAGRPAFEHVTQTSPTFNQASAASAGYTLPTISDTSGGCVDNTWTATSTTNAPSARAAHTAVWTGSEMIVWGGTDGQGNFLNTGARYNPTTDSWMPTSTINAPSGRDFHTAIWTGSEMIVWGGTSLGGTGGRYNPTTDSWMPTSTINVPLAGLGHTAVWTGSEMIVWGGYLFQPGFLNTGGRYNPSTDTWTATSTTNAPAGRWRHTAVWTANKMIVWGGSGEAGLLNTGGRYNPGTDSWTPTSTANAPVDRESHTAVLTESEMVIWGGRGINYFNTGGRYNADSDSWTATSITNAPAGRNGHTAISTDSEMVVWGGFDGTNVLNTGGRYNPDTNSWTATSTTDTPSPRIAHTAVWTGSEMIVWGGTNVFAANGLRAGQNVAGKTVTTTTEQGPDYLVFNTGGRYCAQAGPTPTPTPTATATATPTPTPTPTPCTGRCSPTPRPRPTPAPRP